MPHTIRAHSKIQQDPGKKVTIFPEISIIRDAIRWSRGNSLVYSRAYGGFDFERVFV